MWGPGGGRGEVARGCLRIFIGCMPAPLPPPSGGDKEDWDQVRKLFISQMPDLQLHRLFFGLTFFRLIRRPGPARPQPRLRREAAASSYSESLWYDGLNPLPPYHRVNHRTDRPTRPPVFIEFFFEYGSCVCLNETNAL